MAKEICISSTPHETRLAILEDDQLAEIYYERENEYTLAGSIYNGRVTRVLPGMQSAFVDVGLERDAFLYVTDFLELEDQEETDELEKAAISGGNKPPREVRHTSDKEPAQQERVARPSQKPEQKQESRQEPRQDPRQDRPARGRRLTVEALPETEAAPLPASGSVSLSEQPEAGEEDSGEPGAKRWRGRRRRRGGRGAADSTQGQPERGESPAASIEEITETEPEVAPQIHAGAGVPTDRSSSEGWSGATDRSSSPKRGATATSTTPFVIPGESLSKYGGAPAEGAPQDHVTRHVALPVRPESSFKPTTMIKSPIVWDGSGLLPGESLSKHRKHKNEPASEATSEPRNIPAPDAVEKQDFVEEISEPKPESAPESAPSPEIASAKEMHTSAAAEDFLAEDEPLEEDEFEETSESALLQGDPAFNSETWESTEPEDNATASHNVDPLPPAEFRFFGLGKKKPDEKAAKKTAKTISSSTYAPGSGLIEEETIEEEEFVAPRHPQRAKSGDHDTDDFEEETLPNQLRTGDLGEMLQEAHLDHRIQLNFDEKGGEDEGFDEEDEEEPSAEGQPAAGTPGQRRDRNPRGGRHGDLSPDAMITAAPQEIDQRPPLLRRESFVVAVLNTDQIEAEGGDFGQVGFHHIRIVRAGFEPASSVRSRQARPVIHRPQEDMLAAGGKAAIDHADLLLRLP